MVLTSACTGCRSEVALGTGRPVAVLAPVGCRPRWMGKGEFMATVAALQADAGLAADLDEE